MDTAPAKSTTPASFAEIFARSPVIAVITVKDAAQSVPIARALIGGGIRTLEITLRTPVALEAIARIVQDVPEILVGAGTVLNPDQMRAAIDAGAAFTISPGTTSDLFAAGRASPVPYLPGIATASELMTGLDYGYQCFKLFPVMPMGGAALVRVLGLPFARVRFCVNGGVALDSSAELLREPNVHALGAAWLAPAEAQASEDWSKIESLARAAVAGLRKA